MGVSNTETDTIKQLTISNIPNNTSYTYPATYNFDIKGYIGDGVYDTVTLSFELTQNAIGETYNKPYIYKITVNNGEILPEAIPSAETKINIELIVKQKHNGKDELVTEFEELQY